NIKYLFMMCADICGVEWIYPFGGPQTIKHLGTNKVDKIVVPYSVKKLMFGSVDSLSGPSKGVIVIDKFAKCMNI
ncbi:hypothetical protein ACA081_00105, partial [Candidatus Hodgkinia cicadicola]